MGRNITILGMGPSAARKADVIEIFCKDTEIWTLNNAYLNYPQLTGHITRYFELHSADYLETWIAGQAENGQQVDHFKMLDRLGCPVYTVEPIQRVQNQHRFPAADIVQHFGAGAEYKGSPSWMLAMALWEHENAESPEDEIESIQSWGIDTGDPQHVCQRPSWAQWTLRAEQAGIELKGTIINFRNEPDNDAGLNGLKEWAIQEMNKE